MKWFRFYHEAYRNPKVQEMRAELFKFWVNFLCVASESSPRGTVASEAHLRLALGLTKPLTSRYVSELEALSLLHRDEQGGLTPHDWHRLQPEGDDAGLRKRRQRTKTCGDQPDDMSRDMSRDKNVTSCDSRARVFLDGEKEEEGEENPPLPPVISLGPEYRDVGEWAIQLAGDVSWGSWVDRQGMCGHSAAVIRKAIEVSAGAGKLTQGYVASKLQAWAVEGPPKRQSGFGTAPAAPSKPKQYYTAPPEFTPPKQRKAE